VVTEYLSCCGDTVQGTQASCATPGSGRLLALDETEVGVVFVAVEVAVLLVVVVAVVAADEVAVVEVAVLIEDEAGSLSASDRTTEKLGDEPVTAATNEWDRPLASVITHGTRAPLVMSVLAPHRTLRGE
jgi:hypothetical protein